MKLEGDHDERAAALFRETLRSSSSGSLGPALRAQIAHRAAQRSQRRLWPLLVISALLGALAVACGLYLGVIAPARERAVLAEARARVGEEREAAALRMAEERARALERLEGSMVRDDSEPAPGQPGAPVNADVRARPRGTR